MEFEQWLTQNPVRKWRAHERVRALWVARHGLVRQTWRSFLAF